MVICRLPAGRLTVVLAARLMLILPLELLKLVADGSVPSMVLKEDVVFRTLADITAVTEDVVRVVEVVGVAGVVGVDGVVVVAGR